MFPIFLLENNQYYLDSLSTIIKNYVLFHGENYVFKFKSNSSTAMMNYLKENPSKHGLYFLDIDMKEEMSGISVGEFIKEIDPPGKIVFVTAYPVEYALLTLEKKLEPLTIIKKNNIEKIRDAMIESFELFSARIVFCQEIQHKHIKIKSGTSVYLIDQDKFYMATTTTIPHQLLFITDHGQYSSYGSIKDYENKYTDLLRVSKSSLINPNKVVEIDYKKKTLTFDNNLKSEFSNNRKKNIKAYFDSNFI